MSDRVAGAEAGPIDAAPAERVRRIVLPPKPTAPWVPRRLSVYPVGKAKTTHRGGKTVKCWDLRWLVDGFWYSKRFTQPAGTATQAAEWAKRLNDDFAKGWVFDPRARRFVPPNSDEVADSPTVAETAVGYLRRHWSDWEPRTRDSAVRALARMCEFLVLPDAPALECETVDVKAVLVVELHGTEPDDPGIAELAAYLAEWSRPFAEIGWEDIERLVHRYSENPKRPGTTKADATLRRFEADLRQFFSENSARAGLPDPYGAYASVTKSSRRRRAASRLEPVDADIVLSPSQVQWLAVFCAHYGAWGPVVICFILVMGFCGLRPGEALALERGNLELPEEGWGWLRFNRSAREVSPTWLAEGEDPSWGGLKGRSLAHQRRVPVPAFLVALLKLHLQLFCPGSNRHDLVFQRGGRPFGSNFSEKVWHPARAAMFPPDPSIPLDDPRQPKLSKLRLHDLRHAACSWWLQSGVGPRVCQKWSGHKTLSVFLDIYSGVLPGSEEEGMAALERSLAR